MTDGTAPAQRLDQSVIDELWDFADPVASSAAFQEAAAGRDGSERAELLTQQARALGLRGSFDQASALLDEIDELTAAVRVRVLLERGRLHTSSNDPNTAVPLFRAAVELAELTGLDFLQVDSLHMLSIADAEHAAEHTAAALTVLAGTSDPRTRRWGVALHNNLGWTQHDAGNFAEALAEFESALAAAAVHGTADQQHVARWSVARCLRSLGRYREALVIQQDLLANGPEDEHVGQEIQHLTVALAAEA